MSSPTEERFGIRALLVLDENHFCLIFILGRKKSSADVLRFHDMMWKRKGAKISCSQGAGRGLSLQADLPSCQVSVPRTPRAPAGRPLEHRHVEPPLGTGRSGLAEHPTLCVSHHPYSLPSILILCAWGCRTDGNQFTGKQAKAENSTKRWPGSCITVFCGDNLCRMCTLCSPQQNSPLFFLQLSCFSTQF